MATLSRFRIVRLSNEVQKEFNLREFICADPEGMPFPEGQTFYHWIIEDNACEPTTAFNYLSAILPFLTFLWESSPSLRYTAPAERIRNQVRAYLKEKLGCAVRPHRNGNFIVKISKTITATSARLFLTSLRRFYFCAKLKGWYTDTDPFEWSNGLTREREFKPHMPPSSGLTLPENKRGRMPDTYFCVVAEDWHPRIIDDPHLRQRLLPAFTCLRDRVIAHILFDSGARISEVLRLTFGDWRKKGQHKHALTTNKGSGGECVKVIWWSDDAAQLLRNYINQDRRLCDLKGLGLDDLPDSAPLFITEQGKPYSYAAFYANWQRACEQARLKITPHQVRHWYVTMALHLIDSNSDHIKREAYRQSLIAYMGWRNRDTIKAYDHHTRAMDFAPIHTALAHLGEQENNPVQVQPSKVATPVAIQVVSEELEHWLSQKFGLET